MAQIISGKDVAAEIQKDIRNLVQKLAIAPTLAIVQVGNREDSNVYIRMKKKFADDVGVKTEHIQLPKGTTEEEVSNCNPDCFPSLYLNELL